MRKEYTIHILHGFRRKQWAASGLFESADANGECDHFHCPARGALIRKYPGWRGAALALRFEYDDAPPV